MSQRINISVPDDLYQKMQSFKDSLNVSKICQDAIRREIMLKELREETVSDIDKLAASFQKERKVYGHGFWEEGFKDGTKDAFKTDFQWMYTIWTHRDAESDDKLFEMGASKETTEKVQNEEFETDLGFFIDFDHIADLYYSGWVEGFLDVWGRVSKKLSIDSYKY
jgi:hypothetical protein